MAAVALMGILSVWFLHRGRVRLWSIGLVLLGLIAGLLLYSQVRVFGNWRDVLLAAIGLFFLAALAYLAADSLHEQAGETRFLPKTARPLPSYRMSPSRFRRGKRPSFQLPKGIPCLRSPCKQDSQAVLDTDSSTVQPGASAASDSPEPQTEGCRRPFFFI